MSDEIGPRMAGGRTSIRGRFGRFLRSCQAERHLTDAALLRGGGASHAKNLAAYLGGSRLPDNRLFQQLIDSFRNAGNGLFFAEIEAAKQLWWEEASAWDRYTSGQTEWVSESSLVPPTGVIRSKRAPKSAGGRNVSKSRQPRQHHKETAGERGFEPLIA